jgi:UDP-glucose 4-epimerase
VLILDSLEGSSEQSLRAIEADKFLIKGSTRDTTLLENIFSENRIDAVIHFAAYKKGGESVMQPANYFLNNVAGTFTLLAAMARYQVKSFVFSSSGAIYGNASHLPVSEKSELNPVSPYGESKLLVERALPWYEQAYGLKSVSLRYFNAAGAAPDGRIGEELAFTGNLIPLAIKAALGETPVFRIFGADLATRDGSAIRDFVHVTDLAVAHVMALEHLKASQQSATYNLGTGEGTTVREIVQMVKRVSGRDFKVEELPGRAGEPAELWADCSLARRELGWQPRYSLEDMVVSAYNWYNKGVV